MLILNYREHETQHLFLNILSIPIFSPSLHLVNEIEEPKTPEIKVYSFDEEITTSFELTPEAIETPNIINETPKQEFVINDVTNVSEVNSKQQVEANSREEQIRLAQERIKKLKELTLKMKTPEGLNDLEKTSAWQRKQVNLDANSPTPSTDSQVSRYTLGENNEIRPNNSFLHDNVD